MEATVVLGVLAILVLIVFTVKESSENNEKWGADWRCISCDKSYSGKDIRKSTWAWVELTATREKAWMCRPCYNHQHHGGEMPSSLSRRVCKERELSYLSDSEIDEYGITTGSIKSKDELLWLFERIWDSANGSTSQLASHYIIVERDASGRRFATFDGRRLSKAKIEERLRTLAEKLCSDNQWESE